MTASGRPEYVTDLAATVAARWRTLDPLLPEPVGARSGCGAELRCETEGRLVATGTCQHWVGEPGSLELTWGAAQRYSLVPVVADPDVGGALGQLLTGWAQHLATAPHTDDPDTAAIVEWPSRDIDGVGALLRHGLAPLSVIAARTTPPLSSEPGPGAAGADGVLVRRAGSADIEAVVRLGLETIRYDAHFGQVVERPHTAGALRTEMAGLLAAARPWVWLAERQGSFVGALIAEPPDAAAWLAPMVRLAPVAYAMLMFVEPRERGRSIGATLARHFHAEAAAARVPVTLLHYEQTNPLSAPFWAQQGYRPLWTSWQVRPARALR